MKKKLYITDLKVGDSVYGEIFAVKSYVKKASRNNKPYIDIELTDNSGTIKGKIWSDDFSNCDVIDEGTAVIVNGSIEEFNGPQFKVTNLKKIDKFEVGELQQKSAFNIDEMWQDVEKTISKIKNPHILKLLKAIFDKDTTDKYKSWPAAYKLHQNYVGGLLEHTWEMLKMASALKDHYPRINMDLVNAGIILHDIGKIEEYTNGLTIGFSDKGKLLGHIYLGAEMVKHKAPTDMPKDLLDEILHIILSHVGHTEFGSPAVPMTTEAMAVFVVDHASARLNMAYYQIHGNLGKDSFTQYIPQLGTELYRSPYIENEINEDIPF